MAAANIQVQIPHYTVGSSPARFLEVFNNYCTLANVGDDRKAMCFSLALSDPASEWYYGLPQETKATWEAFSTAFKNHYALSPQQKVERMGQLFTANQQPGENAEEYVNRMRTLSVSDISENILVQAIVKGFNSTLKPLLLAKEPTTVQDVLKIAKAAQGATAQEDTKLTILHQQVQELTRKTGGWLCYYLCFSKCEHHHATVQRGQTNAPSTCPPYTAERTPTALVQGVSLLWRVPFI